MNRIGNNIKNKVSNNRGVSILFSMLLFLVVSLVSITIIVASSSSIKRTNSSKNTMQYNLATESAALMIKDDLSDKSCTYTYTATGGYRNNNCDSSIFKTEQQVISLNILNGTLSYDSTFTIKASNLKDVKVSVESINKSSDINDSYLVTFKLECLDGTKSLSTIYEKFHVNKTSNGTSSYTVSWVYYMANSKEF